MSPGKVHTQSVLCEAPFRLQSWNQNQNFSMKWTLPWSKAAVTSRWYVRGFTHDRVEATLKSMEAMKGSAEIAVESDSFF